jgi:SnoaL-like domain
MLNDPTALSRLLDEAAIQRAIAHFADAATRADYDSFRALWSRDAKWTIGDPPRVHASGIDGIVAMLRKLRAGKEFFVQFAFPGVIEIDGDQATVRGVGHESARAPENVYYRNHYMVFDRLHREGDRWLFTSRTFTYIWLDTSPFEGQGFGLSSLYEAKLA